VREKEGFDAMGELMGEQMGKGRAVV